jgi:hypothetical protein
MMHCLLASSTTPRSWRTCDKTTLASALLPKYSTEIERHWAPIIAAAHTVATSTFAELLIQRTMDFFQERPAYFILREAFVQAFQAKNPSLSHDNALLIANVVLETVKGFLAAVTTANPNQRSALTIEFTQCWPSIWKRNLTDVKTPNAVTIPSIHRLCFGPTGESKRAEVHPYKLRNQGNFHFDDRRTAPLCHRWLTTLD